MKKKMFILGSWKNASDKIPIQNKITNRKSFVHFFCAYGIAWKVYD